MRVVVDIPESYSELLSDLEACTPRQRAGRIRMLATVGVLSAKGRFAPASPDEDAAHVDKKEVKPAYVEGNPEYSRAFAGMSVGILGSMNRQ